jgi:hypothetical protein
MDDDEASLVFSTHSREHRLAQGATITLFHQTDQSCADAICSSQRMERGSDGVAGGGIYFAASAEATHGKAHRRGVILSARVRLGRSLRLPASGDGSLTFQQLLARGYDSVIIDRHGGTEYVVYNWDQVSNITVHQVC